MKTDFVKEYATTVLLLEAPEKLDFFTHLINNGLIDYQRLKKGCINHFYDKICKENGGSDKNAIIDTAIEFDCTSRTVYNTVYKFNDVRLKFD